MHMLNYFFLLQFTLQFYPIGSQSFHINNPSDRKMDQLFEDPSSPWLKDSQSTVIQKVLVYLSSFGYLSENLKYGSKISGRSIIELIDTETAKEAIRTFQSMFGLATTGVIDYSTLHAISLPRCGNKDLANPIQPASNVSHKRFRRYVVKRGSVWKKKHISYSILNYPTRTTLSKQRIHQIIRKAFDEWSKHSPLYFHEIKSSYSDFNLTFVPRYHGDGNDFDGVGTVLAHAFYPGGSLRGVVHFDDAETWTENTPKGANLLLTATHELGHGLGIDHTTVAGSVMLSRGGYRKDPSIQPDDIGAVQALYGKPQPNKEALLSASESTNLDLCDTKIDAISTTKDMEILIFYKEYVWKIADLRTKEEFRHYVLFDYPRPFSKSWPIFPNSVKRFDVVFAMENNDTMFIAGNKFWIVDKDFQLSSGIPSHGLPLTELGLPNYVKKVDAIFLWGYVNTWLSKPEEAKKRSFLFSGEYFWEFKQPKSTGAYGKISTQTFPRKISDVWENVPNDIDTAYTTHSDYKTYFFKGEDVYRFSNRFMKVEEGYPKHNNDVIWLGCKTLKRA